MSIRRRLERRPGEPSLEPLMRRLLRVLAALAIASCTHQEPAARPTTVAPAAQPAAKPASVRTGRAPIHGVTYYYEIHGEGEPLVLLHGGLGSTGMFAPILPILTASRQVILVDLQGHGRTTLGERPIRLQDNADDLAALLDQLGYGAVDVAGYSLGGGVALRLAIQHPTKVRRLAVISMGFSRDGFYPEMLPQQAAVGAALAGALKDTPMYKSYVAIAPNPADFPQLLDRIGVLMRTPYDWTAEVKQIKAPTILVFGDSDMFRPEHMVAFYQLLGGGRRDAGWQREHLASNRLAILPNVTHYEMFMVPAMAATVLTFLDGKSTVPSWSEQVSKQ
jgi:pimeloyl-ACP methyl ester carboxylesterase